MTNDIRDFLRLAYRCHGRYGRPPDLWRDRFEILYRDADRVIVAMVEEWLPDTMIVREYIPAVFEAAMDISDAIDTAACELVYYEWPRMRARCARLCDGVGVVVEGDDYSDPVDVVWRRWEAKK